MIISKPKVGTLFSVGVFVTASLMAAGYGASNIKDQQTEWYFYALFLIFGPLGLGLLLRMILKYKIVRIGKGSITIHFPIRFSSRNYKLNQLTSWKETAINTAGGKYKEVELLFDNKRKLYLSMQEHTNYPQVLNYLRKKAGKKSIS